MADRRQVRLERSAKRVRAMIGGRVVADSQTPLLVWERPYYPTYYFPRDDVSTESLVASGELHRSESRGEATVYDLKADGREVAGAAYAYLDSPVEELRDHLALVWSAMDHWYEEDEEVFVHPRDPYKRIDVLKSSRHVRIEIDGETVAESGSPTLLFETGLPTRYYLPQTAVRMESLTPTDTVTECPYKGEARYWSARIGGSEHPDVAWSYPYPTLESIRIAGLMAFYDEKVDVYVDRVLQERPRSPFS